MTIFSSGPLLVSQGFRLFKRTDNGEDAIFASEADRDTYFSNNPDDLTTLDNNEFLIIKIDEPGQQVIYQQRFDGQWVDITPLVQGPPGSAENLDDVSIGHLPVKRNDNTFGDSGVSKDPGDGSFNFNATGRFPGSSVEVGTVSISDSGGDLAFQSLASNIKQIPSAYTLDPNVIGGGNTASSLAKRVNYTGLMSAVIQSVDIDTPTFPGAYEFVTTAPQNIRVRRYFIRSTSSVKYRVIFFNTDGFGNKTTVFFESHSLQQLQDGQTFTFSTTGDTEIDIADRELKLPSGKEFVVRFETQNAVNFTLKGDNGGPSFLPYFARDFYVWNEVELADLDELDRRINNIPLTYINTDATLVDYQKRGILVDTSSQTINITLPELTDAPYEDNSHNFYFVNLGENTLNIVVNPNDSPNTFSQGITYFGVRPNRTVQVAATTFDQGAIDVKFWSILGQELVQFLSNPPTILGAGDTMVTADVYAGEILNDNDQIFSTDELNPTILTIEQAGRYDLYATGTFRHSGGNPTLNIVFSASITLWVNDVLQRTEVTSAIRSDGNLAPVDILKPFNFNAGDEVKIAFQADNTLDGDWEQIEIVLGRQL